MNCWMEDGHVVRADTMKVPPTRTVLSFQMLKLFGLFGNVSSV